VLERGEERDRKRERVLERGEERDRRRERERERACVRNEFHLGALFFLIVSCLEARF
jgi:hypothetical protein